jgi:hypothetical protein
MRDGTALDKKRYFGSVELGFGVVVRVPVDFDGGEVLDCFVVPV